MDQIEWPYGYGICHCGCGEKTTIPGRSNATRGWVRGVPLRFRQGHFVRTRPHLPREIHEARFWAHVDRSAGDDACWPWVGHRSERGYGRCGHNGESAHRRSWTLTNGAIPEGMLVCHACDNPPCVNPAHLWLGTNDDNMADMVTKGRASRGQRNFNAILTPESVQSIRAALARGEKMRDIAAAHGLASHKSVCGIANGRLWRHVA